MQYETQNVITASLENILVKGNWMFSLMFSVLEAYWKQVQAEFNNWLKSGL